MNTKIIKTLMKKEMLDVFRDKKTVIMMLVVPVILYPLIFIGVMQVIAIISSSMEEQTYRIAVEAEDDDAFLQRLIQVDGSDQTATEAEDAGDEEETEAAYRIEIVDAASISAYEEALEAAEIDAYIKSEQADGKMRYNIYYLSSETNSSYALNIITDVFDDFREELTREKIQEAGLDVHEILEPVLFEKKDTASSEQSLGSILGAVLPFMLIISLLMGTMYPAIDTTAGERERGTLETILTLPVTNRQLIISKFLTVAIIGIISALLNILSMGGIALYMYKILDLQTEMQALDITRFLPAILVGILAIFAFSLLISAVTMCVTAFAKTYKEANNYITPLMLIVMFTGYIGFIPNVELTQTMAMIPVANICLLIKNMLIFKVDYMAVAIVLISNIAYAIFAIMFLSKIYDSESILFGDAKGGFQLFEKRSNLQKGGVPTVSDVWFVVALTILLVLYAGSMLQLKFGLAGVFGTQMILLVVPLFLVIYTKKDIRQTYGFGKSRASGYLGGLFMILGLYLLNIVISFGLISLFPESADNIEVTFSGLMEGNVGYALLVIALAPAICEEMLFRGVIFHSMKARYRVPAAMTITAVLFGIYHMSLVKLIPTGLLGFFLCYVVYMTDSIYPAMMMHFLNNAVSVLVSYYPEQLQKIFPVFYKEMPTVSDVLILFGAGLIFIGIGLIILKKRPDSGEKNGTDR